MGDAPSATTDTAICRGLSLGVRVSLVIIAEAALLSATAVTALLSFLVFNARRNKYRPPHRQWHFRNPGSPVEYYVLSLLVSDLIQAIGGLLSIRWVYRPEVSASPFCTAQGAIKQLGSVGVALATLAIGFHTFFTLCFGWMAPESRWLPFSVIASIWTYLVLIIAIPATVNTNYYYPAGPWCWISKAYANNQIGLEHGCFWATAIILIILYGVLFFCLRGNLTFNFEGLGWRKWIPRVRWMSIRSQNAWEINTEQRTEQMDIARQMVWFPVAYIIMIIPLTVTRLHQFNHQASTISPAALGITGVLFGLSGFINVLLYVVTRPGVWRSVRMLIAV